VSTVDPVAALLANLDRALSPRPEFEQALRALLLTELRTPASTPAARRSFSYALPPIRRWTRLRLALVSIVLFLLLAGVATATYVIVSDWGGGVVSSLNSPNNGVDSISGVGHDGKVSTTWRCPRNVFCGDLVSVAWAPDGKRIAFSLTEFGGHSLYPGLHVVDTVTGRDQHLIGVFSQRPATAVQRATWLRQARAYIHRYGCLVADQLSWSPDGSKIAYACAVVRNKFITSEIHIINADGSGPRMLRTGTSGAAWPSWSPDGTRIVFSTAQDPREHVRTDTTQPDRVVRSSVYTIQLNGAHRQLVVNDAAAPAWSPDGSLIVYRSACGRVRLATPGGHDATPTGNSDRCSGIGPGGWPIWAPDGTSIAIGTSQGIYLVDPDGTHLKQIAKSGPGNITGSLRPAWQPIRGKTR
jgi:dipeptidyl aminopeptidase/acylaminoacyl peptidase